MAILQGSEVAYVERALVRAPATFLGYEARKEGIIFAHASQAYAWLLFCCTHRNCSTVPSGDYSEGPETKNRVRMQLFCDCGLSGGAKTQIAA